MNPDPIHRDEFTVPPEAVDGNGHVNNVVWVQWMQDVAIRHAESVGGNQAMREAKASWVVRSHGCLRADQDLGSTGVAVAAG